MRKLELGGKRAREAIGAVIAYHIDWHKLKFRTVIRAGGTIALIYEDGKEYRITVTDG